MKTRLFILVLLTGCVLHRSSAVTVVVGNADASAGTTAVIPVTLANAPTNLSAFCFFLTNLTGLPLPSVAPGPSQPNLVTFVDDFGAGIYRVSGFVTNNPAISNGVVANLYFALPTNTAPGTYPLTLPAAPPADAPVGPNPEARSLVTSDLIASAAQNGSLAIFSALFLTAPAWLGNGQFQFSFNAATQTSYTVQYATNLSSPRWFSLSNFEANASPATFIDDRASGDPARYYRVKVGP